MDCVRPSADGCRDDVGDVEVRLGAGGLPDAHGLVCQLRGHAKRVQRHLCLYVPQSVFFSQGKITAQRKQGTGQRGREMHS